MKTIVAALLAAAAALSAAHAQNAVYRCGNTYSQAPCPDAKQVEVGDARSAAQQAEARRVADDERRLAAEMRRERLADEHASRPGGAASLSGHAPVKLAVIVRELPHKRKHTLGRSLPTTDFVAFDPSSRKRRSGV